MTEISNSNLVIKTVDMTAVTPPMATVTLKPVEKTASRCANFGTQCFSATKCLVGNVASGLLLLCSTVTGCTSSTCHIIGRCFRDSAFGMYEIFSGCKCYNLASCCSGVMRVGGACCTCVGDCCQAVKPYNDHC